MSSAIRSRLLKANKILASYRKLTVNHANYRPLVKKDFNSFKLLRTPKISRTLVANCTDVTGSRKEDISDEETRRRILEDDDIQNILQDFAKDFDVDEESNRILEDIKRTQALPEDSEAKTQSSTSEKTSINAYRMLSQDKFSEFKDADSDIVRSYEEEINETGKDYFFHIDDGKTKKISMEVKRGVTGVYDIHELVDVLHEENLFNIAVIKIPDFYHYADYMVLANAKSPRHLEAAAEYVVKFYKKKKNKEDRFVVIEGEKLATWKAIDMDNIVLHLMMEDVRSAYDIESLWVLDKEFDTGGKGQDDDEELNNLKEQMEFLEKLQSTEPTSATDQQVQQ